MREWNFENDNGMNPDMHFAKVYVEHWQEIKKDGHGLLFWGGIGSGKSYMAACIANELLEQEVRVLMTNFATIINMIDRRVRSGKPMIITTDLTMKEMDETQDLNEARIYDRIRAVCQPVQVKGESQRKVGRGKMMDKFREIFIKPQGKEDDA